MGLAVIAAEDQKFPEHWGFDVAAIEKALAHNERHENRVRGRQRCRSRRQKICFCGMAEAGCEKGWKRG
jgi:monofunctional biosynthetic peptidoglycan transglycosylase